MGKIRKDRRIMMVEVLRIALELHVVDIQNQIDERDYTIQY